MTTFLTTLHILVCVFMIVVILLQRGKGAEIGAVFGGGGASTVFGSRGAGNFLTKLTTASAIIFMITSLSLSYLSTSSGGERLFEDGVNEEAQKPAASPFEQVETVPPPKAPAAEGEPPAATPAPPAQAAPAAQESPSAQPTPSAQPAPAAEAPAQPGS